MMTRENEYKTAKIKYDQERAKALDRGDKAVEAARKTTQDLPTLSIEEAQKLLEESDKLVYAEVMAEFKKLREKLRRKIED